MSAKCDIIVTGFVGFLESSLSGFFLVVSLYLLNERYHVEHHDLDEAMPKYLRYFIWYALTSIGFWMFLLCGVLKVCSKKLRDFYSQCHLLGNTPTSDSMVDIPGRRYDLWSYQKCIPCLWMLHSNSPAHGLECRICRAGNCHSYRANFFVWVTRFNEAP